MRRLIRWAIFLAILGIPVFWWITKPQLADEAELAALTGDATAGEQIFFAGGCSSCHAASDATGPDKLKLGGGLAFKTAFGTFYAPNISPSEAGIGSWSAYDLVNAMKHGVSPEGQHYYPAFPYASYAKVEISDIVDLKAYLDTLEPVEIANKEHEVGFPFNIRRTLGGWKFLFVKSDWVLETDDETLMRGRYLVEGLGHCSECHTSRNPLGGLNLGKWLAGGPNPDGKGRIPNITPHETGIASWSTEEIIEYLFSGFTPDFDVAGGGMADVVINTGKLTDEDRMAIAAYLKAMPAMERVN